jgi:hypothetical protein
MRRAIVRTLAALVAGVVFVGVLVWYASVDRHVPEQWPVFVGPDGTVHVGADVGGLRVVGLDLSQEEHDEMVARWMNAAGP